jgi:fatty acid elongase 3
MELGIQKMNLSLAGLQHKIQTFEFVPGKTPLASLHHVIAAAALYLLTLAVLRFFMKNRDPLKLKGLGALHNLILSSFSGICLVAILYYFIPIWYTRGTYTIACDPGRDVYTKGPLIFWFYLFYLSKIYEFLDTIFQVFRKKPLKFLHVYHHCITLGLVWLTLQEGNPMQWADITANLFVHVIMYYYYYKAELGIQIWWKKYITTIQIIQFLWDMSWHLGWYFLTARLPPNTCAGTMFGFHFSNFVILSFLFLFIHFYIQTYSRKPKRA